MESTFETRGLSIENLGWLMENAKFLGKYIVFRSSRIGQEAARSDELSSLLGCLAQIIGSQSLQGYESEGQKGGKRVARRR